LALKAKRIGQVGAVKVRGTLTGGDETQEVRNTVQQFLDNGTDRIVLDLFRVKWMNSHGIGMLMGVYSMVQQAGGRIILSRVCGKVQELLETTKVITLFERADDFREAVKRLE